MKLILKLILNFIFGAIPSFLFFIWIERNCSLPNITAPENPSSWPWVQLDLPLVGQCLWNFSLLLIFGAIHTFTAQAAFQRFLSRFFTLDFHRSIFMIITGITITLVMALWQNTGVIIWLVPHLNFVTLNLTSALLYLFFVGLAVSVILKFDALSFVGIRQVFDGSANPKTSQLQTLQRDGFFRYVRHPIYLFTLLAITVTPFMTLDRLIVAVGTVAYLKFFGLRFEERKLVEIFGEPYRVFQREVPALWPFKFFS